MENLHTKSKNLIDITRKALDWNTNHAEALSKPAITEQLTAIRRDLKKVYYATRKRPGVAIFGQSQAGKSYLVRTLAKPISDSSLSIYIPGQPNTVDFINEINPGGDGKESTGVVTRFTTIKKNLDPAFPVRAELFSQLDIAAILCNAFWSDLKAFPESDISGEDLTEEFESLVRNGRSSTPIQNTDGEDDAYLFCQYILEVCIDSYHIRKLKDIGYFKLLKSNFHQVSDNARIKLLSHLWLNDSFITALFQDLSNHLNQIQHEKVIYLPAEGIFPNKENLLDIQRVREIYHNKNSLSIKGDSERIYQINKAYLGCLTKEIELTVDAGTSSGTFHSFFNDVDILDFPGSKSRELIPYATFASNSDIEKLQLFIRGKVSFLFDTYTGNDEVCSLIFCQADAPPEDKGIRLRLYKWIQQNVGGSPDARKQRIEYLTQLLQSNYPDTHNNMVSPLLFILTKFNVEMSKFDDRPVSSIHDSKWLARIGENFENFFNQAVQDKWVTEWTSQTHPFKFVFPVRDPQFSMAFFDGWDAMKEEISLKQSFKNMFVHMGESFTHTHVVQSHVHHPDKIWGELISPNGTGLKYLSDYLSYSANPLVTYTKQDSSIQSSQEKLIRLLNSHAVSGDIENDLKTARVRANQFHLTMGHWTSQNRASLAEILLNLRLTDSDIWSLLWHYKFAVESPLSDPKTQMPQQAQLAPFLSSINLKTQPFPGKEAIMEKLKELYGLSDEDIIPMIEDAWGINLHNLVAPQTNTQHHPNNNFGHLVIRFWQAKVLGTLEETKHHKTLTENQKSALLLGINELFKARPYLRLEEEIHAVTGSRSNGVISRDDFNVISSACKAILNNFLFTAGWSFIQDRERPVNKLSTKTVFAQQIEEPSPSELSRYHSGDTPKVFIEDWVWGLKELFTFNVHKQYGVSGNIDPAANEILKKIIQECTN